MIVRVTAWLAVAAICASCTALTRVDKNATLSPEDSIFVIGSTPNHFRIWVSHADMVEKDGAITVKQDVIGIPVLVANPERGFLVGRVRGGATLMISGVRMVRENETFGQGFTACGDSRAMVFTAPAGKVVYVGHATFSAEGAKLFARYRDDFEAARKHIDDNYPNLRGKIVAHGHKLTATGPCPGPQTISITVPGR